MSQSLPELHGLAFPWAPLGVGHGFHGIGSVESVSCVSWALWCLCLVLQNSILLELVLALVMDLTKVVDGEQR